MGQEATECPASHLKLLSVVQKVVNQLAAAPVVVHEPVVQQRAQVRAEGLSPVLNQLRVLAKEVRTSAEAARKSARWHQTGRWPRGPAACPETDLVPERLFPRQRKILRVVRLEDAVEGIKVAVPPVDDPNVACGGRGQSAGSESSWKNANQSQ